MKKQVLAFWVFACLVLAILAVEGFSATAQRRSDAKWTRHISEDWRVDGAGWESYRAPSRVYRKYLSGGAKLTCEDISPEVGDIIQHDQIGDTWYEFQKNGSMGRMISVTGDGYRHFSWMYTNAAYPGTPRYIYANCKDPAGIYIGDVVADGTPSPNAVNAGYSNQTHFSDGTSVIIHHRTAGTPTWYSMLTVDDDVCGGFFTKHWDLPDAIVGAPSGEDGLWPKAEVLRAVDENVTTDSLDYIHVVMTEGNTAAVPVMVAYERCFISPTDSDTLYCQSYVNAATATYAINVNTNGAGAFSPISHFGSSNSVTPVVVVSPVSQKVAIVYLTSACDETGDYLNDVLFFESMNNGNDWIDGTNWPPTNITNITDFGCTGIRRAFHDVSACYDYEDSLHVAYLLCGFDPENPGYYQPGVAEIHHYSKKAGVSYIAAKWQGGTDPGAHNCILAKPSISAQDPIYHPGGDPDSVYLYCIWTQFDSSDVSAGNYANGDIWGCGSGDGGGTWARGYNLTNTQTPGCAPGNCVSEHWSSLAANMYDGDLHIQYVCDRDAGGAIQDGTQWMSNPVMYLHLTDWEVGPCHRCGPYRIDSPPRWYAPPMKIAPDGSQALIFTMFCHGNSSLTYSVSSDHPCIQADVPPTVIPPGDSATVTAIVTGSGACENSFIDGSVILYVDDYCTGEETAYLPVQAVVANDYYECPKDPETVDTLYNGVLLLRVNANCGESLTDSASYPDTAHDIIFAGGTIIATTIGSDTVTGRYMYGDRFAGARDKLYTDECSQEWEPDFWLVYTKDVFMHDFEPPADHKWYWWEMSKQIKFFKEMAPEAYKHLVIKYVDVRRHDPPNWWPDQTPFTGYEDTYVGMLEDMDCPWDSIDNPNPDPFVGDESATNEGGYDATNEIAWTRGWGNNDHPSYGEYYTGMALAYGGGGGGTVPYGTNNVKNNVWVYPHGGWGWDGGDLCYLASQTGNNIEFPESLVDRSQVFTAAKIAAGSEENATAKFAMILAVAPGGLAQLQAYVDTGRAIVEREAQPGHGIPALCGDVNGWDEVSPGDVVHLIGYLFRNGPSALCPVGRADCNGNGSIDPGDIVSLINYLFRNCSSEDCLRCPGIWGP